jgi:hypothetical protein
LLQVLWKIVGKTASSVGALWKLVKVVKQSGQVKKSSNLGIIKAEQRLRSLSASAQVAPF